MTERTRDFEPAFCPSRHCPKHRETAGFRYHRTGTYRRRAPPHRVQRYRCLTCGVYFSRQSFAVTYWLKKPELLSPVWKQLLSCSSFRQIAWGLGVAHSTVARYSARFGRHALLLHEERRPRTAPREALVVDGFQSFEFSQYHPFHFNLAVGQQSWFLYAFTEAELRRSGRMRPDQRARRERIEKRHGRPDPKRVELAMRDLLEDVVPPGASAVVFSDEHPAYPRAMRRLPDRRFTHVTVSSKRPRTPSNPLHPVNDADRLLLATARRTTSGRRSRSRSAASQPASECSR